MKSLFRLLVMGLLLSGWALAAASLHVVRTPQTITIVPKERLGVIDTYVDTRAWTMDDVSNHPTVSRKLINAGKADVLSHLANPGSSQDLTSQLTEAINRGPQPPKTTQPAAADGKSHARLVP